VVGEDFTAVVDGSNVQPVARHAIGTSSAKVQTALCGSGVIGGTRAMGQSQEARESPAPDDPVR
jgi:hypothetical protein